MVNSDAIIIFHTNPDRIYVPSDVEMATRKLESHKTCDMVAENILRDSVFSNQAKMYYKYFFDQTQQTVFYRLLVEDIKKLTSNHVTLHCSGFDVDNAKSFAELLSQHAGQVNHFNTNGNKIVYNYIYKQLNEKI